MGPARFLCATLLPGIQIHELYKRRLFCTWPSGLQAPKFYTKFGSYLKEHTP